MRNNEPSGILLLDKPSGPTSFAMVHLLRKKLGVRKIGHAGTLDPLASGLLVMGIGAATKYLEYLILDTKEYEVGFKLGTQTTTDDLEGEVLADQDVNLSPEEVRMALAQFLGTQEQIPPSYSAVKVQGQRAYDLARAGNTLTLAPRTVEISRVDQFKFSGREGSFSVACSKGTYVRSLVRDLGKKLGCGAVVTSIRRTVSGNFSLTKAISVNDLGSLAERNHLFVSGIEALPSFGVLEISPDLWETKLRFGQGLTLQDIATSRWHRPPQAQEILLVFPTREEIAIALKEATGNIRIKKLLWTQ